MKKRYLYSLLFGIPGLFVAGVISVFAFGALAGALWLFVFGDHPWPAFSERFVSALFVLVVLTLWLGFILLGFFVGKRLEGDAALSRNHILISAGLTLLFILLILFQQWSVGNLGPNSNSALCSEFCMQHGFSASGMPPEDTGNQICSCYDETGNEALRIPLDHIMPAAPR